MDALRKLSMHYVMHSCSPEEYLLAIIQELTKLNDRDVAGVAELFLNAKPGGDGQ